MAEDNSPCPVCGWTRADWKKKHRLGCEHCYDHLAQDLFRWYQKRGLEYPYRGTLPSRFETVNQKRKELEELKARLDRCLKEENYEEAAQVRDQIRAFHSQNGGLL